jgi:hypothetical protein
LASDDNISTNHGGVAVISTPGIRLTQLDLGVQPVSFEMLYVRIASGASSCVAVLVYRPPAAAVASFFVELSDVLDRVITFADPLFVVGDVNIRLDRHGDPATRQFADLLDVRGVSCHVMSSTHDRGGIIDVVITRDDLPAPSVGVVDVGLSDHRMLLWRMAFGRSHPVYSPLTRRS